MGSVIITTEQYPDFTLWTLIGSMSQIILYTSTFRLKMYSADLYKLFIYYILYF